MGKNRSQRNRVESLESATSCDTSCDGVTCKHQTVVTFERIQAYPELHDRRPKENAHFVSTMNSAMCEKQVGEEKQDTMSQQPLK